MAKAKRFLREAVYGLLAVPGCMGTLKSWGGIALDEPLLASSLSRTRRSRVRLPWRLMVLQSLSSVYSAPTTTVTCTP